MIPITQVERRRRRKRIAIACRYKPAAEVARRFKVSLSMVHQACQEQGGEHVSRLSEQEAFLRRQEIAQAIKSGRSIPEVVQQYKISVFLIRTSCAEHGVEYPSATNCPIQTALHVVFLFRDRPRTLQSVAEECGLSNERVRQIKVMAIKAGILNP